MKKSYWVTQGNQTAEWQVGQSPVLTQSQHPWIPVRNWALGTAGGSGGHLSTERSEGMNGSTLSPSLAVHPHSKVGKQSTRAVPGPPTKSRLWACAVGSQKLNRLSTFKHQKIILRNIDLGFFFKKLANLTKLSVFSQVHKNMFMCALLFAMVLTLSFLSPPKLLRTFILSTCCLANI